MCLCLYAKFSFVVFSRGCLTCGFGLEIDGLYCVWNKMDNYDWISKILGHFYTLCCEQPQNDQKLVHDYDGK